MTVKDKDDVKQKQEEEEVPQPQQDDEDKEEEARGPTLQVEIQQNSDDVTPEMMDDDDEERIQPRHRQHEDVDDDEDDVDEDESAMESPPKDEKNKNKRYRQSQEDREAEELLNSKIFDEQLNTDPKAIAQLEFIQNNKPETELELALAGVLERKEQHIARLVSEITKLKTFISKRKQTYKRKRKDEGAPTRALSAYNIFVQDRFAQLAKENDAALKSADTNVQMQRVPPANLVASTGNAWKSLSAEDKAKYEERAKADRKRYEEQMSKYQPPDKQANRKRNKTGYNMFFSAHVLRLKQSELGVPSERGSVARLVGNAWKVRH
jgi:hypothetical protein